MEENDRPQSQNAETPCGESSVVYVSRAKHPFTPDDLSELSVVASQKNQRIDVTGYLYYDQERFVQYLEGERRAVEELLGRIREDPRHRILAVAWEDQLDSRRFPDWGMRWVLESEFKAIELEGLLMDHLVFCERMRSSGPSIDSTIRRMVAGISRLRTKFG